MYERWKQMEEDELKKEEEGCQAGDGWSREGGSEGADSSDSLSGFVVSLGRRQKC